MEWRQRSSGLASRAPALKDRTIEIARIHVPVEPGHPLRNLISVRLFAPQVMPGVNHVAIRGFPDPMLLGIDGLRLCLPGDKLMSHALPIVFLARHGETAWSVTGQHTGLTDLPLSGRGETNARALRERLAGLNFAKVFTSPLQRARRTCELAGFGAVAEVDPNLVEWNYGQYEGLTSAQIRAERPDWQLFRDGCPGGESPEQVAARADAVLGRIVPLRANALLFSSGHFLRVLATRWLAVGALGGRYLLLSTASVSELGYENDLSQPVIRLWNDARHVNATSNLGGSGSKTRLKEDSL